MNRAEAGQPPSHIVAVLVTYNRVELARRALDALLAESLDAVVVVDNASTDGTADWLDALDEPRVDVVHLDRNAGGAGGFMVGVARAAYRHDADWILLLDDDAMPEPGAIDVFRSIDLTDDVGGVAAAVRDDTGVIAEVNRPGLDPFRSVRAVLSGLGGRAGYHVADDAFDRPTTDVDLVSFVGYFVRGGLVRRPDGIGLPDGRLFIFADDQLYSWRVRQHGWRNLLVPAIRFVHSTTTTYRAPLRPTWKAFYLGRNTVAFYRALNRWAWPAMLLAKVPVWLARARFHDDRAAYARLLGLGLADGLRGSFDRPHDDVVRRSAAP